MLGAVRILCLLLVSLLLDSARGLHVSPQDPWRGDALIGDMLAEDGAGAAANRSPAGRWAWDPGMHLGRQAACGTQAVDWSSRRGRAGRGARPSR